MKIISLRTWLSNSNDYKPPILYGYYTLLEKLLRISREQENTTDSSRWIKGMVI